MPIKLIIRIYLILLCLTTLATLPQDSEVSYRNIALLANNINANEETYTLENIKISSISENKPVYDSTKDINLHNSKNANSNSELDANPEKTINQKTHVSLKNQDAAQLWSSWKKLLQQSELQQIPIVNALLAGRIRKDPNSWIYDDIHSFLLNPDFAFENKALLLDLLTEIATPESLNELIELSELGSDSKLYAFVLQAISRIGNNRWDGRFHEELSPALEAAWSNPDITDEPLLNAVGTAIAEVGAPEGVDLILQSIAGSELINTSVEINRPRQPIAYSLSNKVHNPSATESLTDCIDQADPKSPTSEFCLEALAGIDTPTATTAILNHAEKAPDESARQITDAMNKIQNDEALKLLTEAPNSRKFQSTQIQQAVNSIASEIAASNALTLPAPNH
jgi:hypothetical protein